ncbi:MAG TPA: hypothetical protein VEG44_06605 [Candidatus Acidoferrales bacterium]|nr:hypothetical protein [Candidatus Acidoferrales bacterium]
MTEPRQRQELFDLLRNSGKVYLDRQGRELVRKFDASGRITEYVPPQE